MLTTSIKARTAAAIRTARLKQRLAKSGGVRTSINLEGVHVQKLERLRNAGVGLNHAEIIRALILAAPLNDQNPDSGDSDNGQQT